MCFLTSNEYVGVITFFQCVSLIEANAGDNEWLVVIEALQKGEKKQKQSSQKREKRKWSDIVCGQYTNVHKFVQNEMGKT